MKKQTKLRTVGDLIDELKRLHKEDKFFGTFDDGSLCKSWYLNEVWVKVNGKRERIVTLECDWVLED